MFKNLTCSPAKVNQYFKKLNGNEKFKKIFAHYLWYEIYTMCPLIGDINCPKNVSVHFPGYSFTKQIIILFYINSFLLREFIKLGYWAFNLDFFQALNIRMRQTGIKSDREPIVIMLHKKKFQRINTNPGLKSFIKSRYWVVQK